jgi:hypothetical protein
MQRQSTKFCWLPASRSSRAMESCPDSVPVNHLRRELLPPTRQLVVLLQQYWAQPEQQEAARLEAAQLRLPGLRQPGPGGRPGGGKRVGSLRCCDANFTVVSSIRTTTQPAKTKGCGMPAAAGGWFECWVSQG